MKLDTTLKTLLAGAVLATGLGGAVAAETPEDRLVEMGYPQINDENPKPFGKYVNGNVANGLLFVSSAAPQDVNGLLGEKDAWVKGRFGEDFQDDETGIKVAEMACLRSLRFAKATIGDLSKITKVVRFDANISSTTDFTGHTKVADGCSNMLTEVFGPEIGGHARVNLGIAALPYGVAMEYTIIYAVE